MILNIGLAVLVEAFSVIVRHRAIIDRFTGGWPAFLGAIPNATLCDDDDLVRVGFITPSDVEAFVGMLEAGGVYSVATAKRRILRSWINSAVQPFALHGLGFAPLNFSGRG